LRHKYFGNGHICPINQIIIMMTKKTASNFGDLLKSLIKDTDKSQRDLASFLQMDPSQITRMTKSDDPPTKQRLRDLCVFFNVAIIRTDDQWIAINKDDLKLDDDGIKKIDHELIESVMADFKKEMTASVQKCITRLPVEIQPMAIGKFMHLADVIARIEIDD
jgi:transcriptional regulator with XRE-family HTH domain